MKSRTASEVQVIDGFACYAPSMALGADDYPEHGFDHTRVVEEQSFWCRARRRLALALFDRFVGAGSPAKVLEIGCGTGFILEALQARTHLKLTGSEIYLAALRYARSRVPAVELIQLDARANPFSSSFDAIAAFDVLEHIDEDRIVLEGIGRALKPGGVFIVSVPQYQWMWSPLDELVRHKRRYSRRALETRLAEAGFELLFCTSFVTTLFPLMMIARLRARRGRSGDEAARFRAEVTFPPLVNGVFDRIMRVDEALIRAGWSLPFGGSLVAVARKARTRVTAHA